MRIARHLLSQTWLFVAVRKITLTAKTLYSGLQSGSQYNSDGDDCEVLLCGMDEDG